MGGVDCGGREKNRKKGRVAQQEQRPTSLIAKNSITKSFVPRGVREGRGMSYGGNRYFAIGGELERHIAYEEGGRRNTRGKDNLSFRREGH